MTITEFLLARIALSLRSTAIIRTIGRSGVPDPTTACATFVLNGYTRAQKPAPQASPAWGVARFTEGSESADSAWIRDATVGRPTSTTPDRRSDPDTTQAA